MILLDFSDVTKGKATEVVPVIPTIGLEQDKQCILVSFPSE